MPDFTAEVWGGPRDGEIIASPRPWTVLAYPPIRARYLLDDGEHLISQGPTTIRYTYDPNNGRPQWRPADITRKPYART